MNINKKNTRKNILLFSGLFSIGAISLVASTQSCSCSSNANSEETYEAQTKLPTLLKSSFSLKDLSLEGLTFDKIKNSINSDFFYKNRQVLFDNADSFKKSSVSEIKVHQSLPYEITISFKLNGKDQVIRIIQTIEEAYGEIQEQILQNQTAQINTFNNSTIEIKNNNISRIVNDQYYETELLTKYGDQGFRYPSWDYNYESGQNYILNLNDGTTLDMSQAVFNERVPGSEGWKYSDPNFIHSEIKKGQLKKHPAADGMHEQQLNDSEKAVDKYFSLPSTVKGLTSLGLYAPAGEVCKLTFSQETYDQMSKQGIKDFKIVINSSYWDNYARPDTGQISKRYPFVQTEFIVSLYDLDWTHSYEFGTPFGGTISVYINTPLQSSTYNNLYKSYQNYRFNVTGATEMLSYYHGLTTEEEWNSQIERVKNGTLTAPEMSIDFPFGATNISYTGIKEIAYTSLGKIIYPKTQVEKWNDFLILSEYFASRDVKNNITKLDFRFNDDIWGGGEAWGGGNRLSCRLSWAKSAFLTQAEWTISNNWGTLHEINHNFQQNSAFFIGDSHGETNQVTMASFSIISDSGRWRNLANPSGEYSLSVWQRMSNLYSLIQWIKNNNYNEGGKKVAGNGKPAQSAGEYEYQIYGLILFMIGSYNYVNYARHDIATNNGVDSNGNSAEGGFYEILELSDYFKLDFWPALQKYYPIWYDDGQQTEAGSYPVWDDYHKWPKDYNSATQAQRAEIDRLRTSYKSFDFIGNLYAAGIYMYDNDTGNYVYTNDTAAPYQIPAGRPYVFDFEKGINWLENDKNYKFSWSQLKFEPTTKLGGTLELDPTNSKKLIYTPPTNSIGQVDEFDMAIIPDADFKGRPSNYVSQYKWKIKVRQVPNAALASSYIFPDDTYIEYWENLDKKVNYMRNESNAINTDVVDLSQGIIYESGVEKDVPGGTRVKLNFIAPKTGKYQFKVKFNFQIKIYKGFGDDAVEIFSDPFYSGSGYKLINKVFQLNEGEILPLDIFILSGSSCKSGDYIYKDQTPNLNFQVLFDDQENVVDFASNIIDPFATSLIDDPRKFITDKQYHYSSNRTIDLNKLQTSLFGLNVSRQVNVVDTNNYKFEAVEGRTNLGLTNFGNNKDIDSQLKNDDNHYMEIWAPSSAKYLELSFNVNFNSITKIGSINFYNRVDNWTQARPKKITIKDQNDNILYSGGFGTQFADASNASTIINFDRIYEVTQLKFTISNDTIFSNTTAIIVDAITFNDQIALQTNKVISIQDPQIYPYGKWSFINNESGENISDVNGQSIKSSTSEDFIVFDMFAQGFDLVGQKALGNSNFDIYINDKFIANVNTENQEKIENTILYSFTSDNTNGEQMRVKIVNKSNKPLYLNYIQTYGKEVYLTRQ